jgi:hypothetical protein
MYFIITGLLVLNTIMTTQKTCNYQNEDLSIRPHNEIIRPHNEIKKWAKSNMTPKEMISHFINFKDSWENKRFININVEEIILKLSRFKKHETLKYIFDNNPNYGSYFNKSNKSPLNEAVWIGKDFENTETICDDIIKTINILIKNKYSFMGSTEFENENENSKETFLDSLMHPMNVLDKNKKNQLYTYFTQECNNKEEFAKDIINIFNKFTVQNINMFKEKIMYILARNIEMTTFIIFEKIIKYNVNNSYSQIILNCIISKPNKSCFEEYFNTIELSNVRKQMCDIILNNYKEWIETQTNINLNFNINSDIDVIPNENVKDTECRKELHTNARKELYIDILNENYMKFYGFMAIYYNNDINKDIIINKLFVDDKFGVKIYLAFFENVEIYKKYTLETLPNDLIDTKILRNFIKNNYFSCSNRIKFTIQASLENIFSIDRNKTKSVINNFVNNFENNDNCYLQKTISQSVSHVQLESIIEKSSPVTKLQNKYKTIFNNYFKYVKNFDIENDFKTIDTYFDDIKYYIEKNEENKLYDKDSLITIHKDHSNQILIGLTLSFEEINLTENYSKIMLVIGYLDSILSENFFANMTEFLKTNKFNDIIDEFDNPTLSKFILAINKDLNN